MPDTTNTARRTALVIGGSRGIGAGIVRRLAAEGLDVAFTYAASPGPAADLAAQVEAGGSHALALRADSADAVALQAAVVKAVERFGRLDVLVVNAGVLQIDLIDDFALADFDRMLAINVRGVFVAIQAASPHLSEGGRVITIGSNTAARTGIAGGSVYAMTKAAVAALVRGLALDFAPRKITVNNVQPGPTATDMTSDPAMIDHIKALVPLGRLADPGEIAGLVAYLIKPESAFMTGASLTIDGGFIC
ncbi:MAG: oxidoreductase [Caulobacter sp.]|nr:oxidoreductase [Caulobacter sp.]